MKIIKYDTEKYPFSKIVRSLYEVPLEELDNHDRKKNLALGEDTHTAFHKSFYKKIDEGWPEFEKLYSSFLREVIFPLFEDDVLIYQKYPNIRFHKDHKHPPGEINIFLPITKCYGTNTIWTETLPGFGDYHPQEMEYGEFLIAYLNQTRHGNKTNETDMTRVSFDFRVIPGFAYDENFAGTTATTSKSFKVGEYYDKMTRKKA